MFNKIFTTMDLVLIALLGLVGGTCLLAILEVAQEAWGQEIVQIETTGLVMLGGCVVGAVLSTLAIAVVLLEAWCNRFER